MTILGISYFKTKKFEYSIFYSTKLPLVTVIQILGNIQCL